jgi:hypothetical protein
MDQNIFFTVINTICEIEVLENSVKKMDPNYSSHMDRK